jgi:hypothetical protein
MDAKSRLIKTDTLPNIPAKNRSTRAKEVITSLIEARHLIQDEGVYNLS